MYDFEFYNPTRIIFGRHRENEIGNLLNQESIRHVLLVYGKESIKSSGLHQRVTDSLGLAGIRLTEHGGVSSNPVLSHTRAGIAIAKEHHVDAVLAVGGGSVVDEAKAIAAGVKADADIWDYFTGKEITDALPVFTILTLAATGSEMNGNAVVTNEVTKQKYNISSIHVYPRISILDPELTLTVPPDYIAFGAVDIIAHVIEGYFTKKPGTRLQDRLVEGIIKTVIECTEQIMSTPNDYQARAQFMWTSTLALNGLTPAGIGTYAFPNHMIEHSLSALYNIAHGAGLAIVIPAWMKWYCSKNKEQFHRFAREIFQQDSTDQGILALENWFAKIKAPTRLSQVDIDKKEIPAIAENVMGQAKLWGQAENYPRETIEAILELA